MHCLLDTAPDSKQTCFVLKTNLLCFIILRIRIHGTKHTTIVRNVKGDINVFIDELRAVLKLPLNKKGILTSASTRGHGGGTAGRGVNSENPIRIRTGGAIEVNGDYAREVKRWLAGLGF